MKRTCFLALCLFLCSVASAQNPKTVFLVRHAEKVSDAKDALLSNVGKQRAMCLAGVLADAEVQNIITSDVVRTQQTAQPLADRLHEKLKTIPAGDIDQFVTAVRGAKGNTLVVGHGDTLPRIIEQLTGKSVSIPGNAYDRLLIVTFQPEAGSPVLLHYCTTGNPEPQEHKMVR